MDKCLDLKAKGRANSVNFVSIQSLEDRRLPRVIQATELRTPKLSNWVDNTDNKDSHRNRMRISFSFRWFFLMTVSRPIAKILDLRSRVRRVMKPDTATNTSLHRCDPERPTSAQHRYPMQNHRETTESDSILRGLQTERE